MKLETCHLEACRGKNSFKHANPNRGVRSVNWAHASVEDGRNMSMWEKRCIERTRSCVKCAVGPIRGDSANIRTHGQVSLADICLLCQLHQEAWANCSDGTCCVGASLCPGHRVRASLSWTGNARKAGGRGGLCMSPAAHTPQGWDRHPSVIHRSRARA